MKTGKNPKPRTDILSAKGFRYKTSAKIELPKPTRKPGVSFFDVLESRYSSKEFSKVSLSQISEVLWYSAKVKKTAVTKEGIILVKTNCPSAGALHPIDIFVSFSTEQTSRRLYYYNPFDHSLEELLLNSDTYNQFVNHVNECIEIKDGCLIWLGMDYNRTNSVYENPESLLWRDAGVLLMAIQLVAHSLDLHSCPVGTLAKPFFSDLFKGFDLHSAGGIIVG